jgi:hypothetical protein
MTIDPKKEQERLDALQKDIDRERRELADEEGLTERHFIDSGDEEPVDDTIAPPG